MKGLKALRLEGWCDEHETTASAKTKKRLQWYATPQHYGHATFNVLQRMCPHNYLEVYGIYHLLCQITMQLPLHLRGWLVSMRGGRIYALTPHAIANETDVAVERIEEAIEHLRARGVEWLVEAELEIDLDEKPSKPMPLFDQARSEQAKAREPAGIPADPRESAGIPEDPRESPSTLPVRSDPTGHDPTRPDRTEPVTALACARAGTGAGASAPRGAGGRRGADRTGPDRPGADGCSIPASSRPLIEQLVRDRSPPEERRLVRSLSSIERLAHMEGILALTSRAEAWDLQFHCYADVVCDLYSLPDYANQENSFAAVIRETAGRDDRARIGAECINKLLETRRWLAAGNTGDFWAIWQAHMKRVLWPETRRC